MRSARSRSWHEPLVQGLSEEPNAAPLPLGVDAASLLSLGWASANLALCAALPQPNVAQTASQTKPDNVPEQMRTARDHMQGLQTAAADGYDSDTTIVPSKTADVDLPVADLDTQPAVQKPEETRPQPFATAADDVAIDATADGCFNTPRWLPVALVSLQATATVCADDCEAKAVVGRRVAFALLGELTVGDSADERMLSEGLHIGRCIQSGFRMQCICSARLCLAAACNANRAILGTGCIHSTCCSRRSWHQP